MLSQSTSYQVGPGVSPGFEGNTESSSREILSFPAPIEGNIADICQ